MSKPLEGRDVYQKLMDIDLLLSDERHMGPLYGFLATIRPDNPALAKLDAEVTAFKTRLETLIAVSEAQLVPRAPTKEG